MSQERAFYTPKKLTNPKIYASMMQKTHIFQDYLPSSGPLTDRVHDKSAPRVLECPYWHGLTGLNPKVPVKIVSPIKKQTPLRPSPLRFKGSTKLKNNFKESASTEASHRRDFSPRIFPSTFCSEEKVKRTHANPLRREEFQIIKGLGQGRNGKVYLVRHKRTNFLMAMKVISQANAEINQQRLLAEIKIQSYVCHENIAKLYGIMHDKANVYLLSELASHGELLACYRHKPMDEIAAAPMLKQLVQATDYLHRQNIIHRDIKPQNLLMSYNVLKICDFGWAIKRTTQQLRWTYCGTPLYLSPEMLQGSGYSEKVDVWAIGSIAYEMVAGHGPFDIRDIRELKRITSQPILKPRAIIFSKQFNCFLKCALEKQDEQRASCGALLGLPFFMGV